MLVFSDLSIQLLINWLGRCATPFDSGRLILTSVHRRALVFGVKALLDLYLRGRQAADLLALCQEQSSNEKGKWQRQLEENKCCGAHTQEHTLAAPSWKVNQPEPPCSSLPQFTCSGAQSAACAVVQVPS